MAKKPKPTGIIASEVDEPINEVVTELEAPPLVSDAPVIPDPEPEPDEAAAPASTFSLDGDRYVAEDGTRDLFVRIGGVRYEHVADTDDGKWVYARS